MKSKIIDVVIIGLNEALMLAECIKSVRKFQEVGNIIYVDSGSKDESVIIAMEHADIIICAKDRPSLAGKSRNIGLSAVRSKYVLFLDGDMILKNSPAHFITSLDEKFVGIYGVRNDHFINEKKEELGSYLNRYGTNILKPASHVGGAAIYLTKAVRSVGGFLEELQCYEEPRLLIDLTALNLKVLESPIPFVDHFILGKSSLLIKLKRSYQFGFFFGSCLVDSKVIFIMKIYPLVFLLYIDLLILLSFVKFEYYLILISFILFSIFLLYKNGFKKVLVNIIYSFFLPFSLSHYLMNRIVRTISKREKLIRTA